jgi:hypothetical protein
MASNYLYRKLEEKFSLWNYHFNLSYQSYDQQELLAAAAPAVLVLFDLLSSSRFWKL